MSKKEDDKVALPGDADEAAAKKVVERKDAQDDAAKRVEKLSKKEGDLTEEEAIDKLEAIGTSREVDGAEKPAKAERGPAPAQYDDGDDGFGGVPVQYR